MTLFDTQPLERQAEETANEHYSRLESEVIGATGKLQNRRHPEVRQFHGEPVHSTARRAGGNRADRSDLRRGPQANRLIDPGTTYDTLGDVTTLPPADAGGSQLTSTYYADDQLQGQSQNGQTISYQLDPAERTRETVLTGNRASDIISHYAGPGASPSWTQNTTGEWTRNIAGINGTLAAVQSNGEAPVLQLTNLHGDIVATAYDSETATALASTADTTEFGVPTTSLPPKYSWLGAIELPTELPSGVVAMGARSYVPQLGRFLQPDPIPGGSANAYAYTFGDPVNSSDPSGTLTYGFSAGELAGLERFGQEAVARQVAREEAARREAEEWAAKQWAALAASGSSVAGEGEGWGEEWEEEEEEGGEEEVAYHPEAGGQAEGHMEGGLLYQPLGEAGERTGVVPLCEPGSVTSSKPCAHKILRIHCHWWGCSFALSRHDMRNLSHAFNIAAIAGAKKFAWQATVALGAAGEGATFLEEHNTCLTFWVQWAPGSHGQVSAGPVSAGLYKCYG